jgi:hypothetical protein
VRSLAVQISREKLIERQYSALGYKPPGEFEAELRQHETV